MCSCMFFLQCTHCLSYGIRNAVMLLVTVPLLSYCYILNYQVVHVCIEKIDDVSQFNTARSPINQLNHVDVGRTSISYITSLYSETTVCFQLLQTCVFLTEMLYRTHAHALSLFVDHRAFCNAGYGTCKYPSTSNQSRKQKTANSRIHDHELMSRNQDEGHCRDALSSSLQTDDDLFLHRSISRWKVKLCLLSLVFDSKDFHRRFRRI